MGFFEEVSELGGSRGRTYLVRRDQGELVWPSLYIHRQVQTQRALGLLAAAPVPI